MAISFNEVPANSRVPFAFVEFDNSGALKGPQNQPFKAVIFGQKLSAGTVAAGTLTRVTGKEQAKGFFGIGSQLALMCEAFFAQNKSAEVFCVPLADAGTATSGTGTITFTGAPTENGQVNLMVAGFSVNVGVNSGSTVTAIAAAVAAEINARSYLPVSATSNLGVVTLTSKFKGLSANEIKVVVNYYSETESTPQGLTIAATAISGGTVNPDLTSAISLLAGDQYNIVVNPYTDSANIALIKAELELRWGATVMQEGFCFMAKDDTLANLTTFGETYNTQILSTIGIHGSPTPAWMIAADYAGAVSFSAGIDPARPFQTLVLKNTKAPALSSRFDWSDCNVLLSSGISTHMVDAGGNVCIQRAITMYRQNALGATDVSYLDLTSVLTLSYLRYDFRNMMLTKYPRHKLANDGTRFGPGQAVVTPSVVKAEAISRFRQWEEKGLVENADAFKEGLIVERNTSDVNRLDILLDPDLINQLVISATKIKFIL